MSSPTGDVLFVDTAHTVKTGGDVVWIFQEIIPRLAPGVFVHIHDMFMPGEYPEPWVMEGWGWNETYLVRSFLSFNSEFEIVWGQQYMLHHQRAEVLGAFPGVGRRRQRCGALDPAKPRLIDRESRGPSRSARPGRSATPTESPRGDCRASR